MKGQERLACQGAKCIMRENLCRVYEWRKTGLLCDLGPAVFQTPTAFLEDVLTQRPRSHLIPPSSDLVVFADVHGDFLALLSHLYLAQVVDAQGNWIGGDRWVCSTGDWIDRAGRGEATVDTSHNPREEVDIMQYIHALNLRAAQEGGGVLFTLGNHELRRVQGAEKDEQAIMSPTQVAGWAEKGAKPAQALKRMNKLWRPGGLMARYLANNCPAMARYGRTLLMHGGLESKFARANVDVLVNDCAVLFLINEGSCSDGGLLDHVTKTRALSRGVCPEEDVQQTLDKTGATQLVVGHTIQSHGDMPAACGGKVWRMDFGMSEAFGSDGSINVLLLKSPDASEAVFMTSNSTFKKGAKTYETRRDVSTTFIDGSLVSEEGQLIERKVPPKEKTWYNDRRVHTAAAATAGVALGAYVVRKHASQTGK